MQTEIISTQKIPGAVKSFLAIAAYRAQKEESEVHQNAILDVLRRAAIDDSFRKELFFSGSKALEQYELTGQEKAALISGDIQFIEKMTGTLTPSQKSPLLHRLEAEVW